MPARSLKEHLMSGDVLSRLAAHAGRLLSFQRRLEAALPAPLRAHARVANFKLGKIVIHAANGAVAAKLRQMAPRLAGELSFEGRQVTEIAVKVQPRVPSRPATDSEPFVMPGSESKQALTSLARRMPEGAALKGALERLLARVG